MENSTLSKEYEIDLSKELSELFTSGFSPRPSHLWQIYSFYEIFPLSSQGLHFSFNIGNLIIGLLPTSLHDVHLTLPILGTLDEVYNLYGSYYADDDDYRFAQPNEGV
ncbi:MAG: hypothetical protein EZS28_014400 [Streblomastix strix]|uniref:Uncharacterized protein n=1 Tax=Streblomastix strix TaxID=222440 RepID=A0A5J4W6E5_9EUKA|nr:MAG: hypothetical protein EZS28_014400 [Streblomastix strix]